MKKISTKIISVILCLSLMTGIGCVGVYAADDAVITEVTEDSVVQSAKEILTETGNAVQEIFAGMSPLDSWDSLLDNVMKALYNTLNIIVEVLVRAICRIYPDPKDWKDISENTGEDILTGDTVYRTEAAENSYWSVGYASRSVVPEDFEPGKYYIGRDLLNKKAQGVYDDMRIRITVFDDNSGDGAIILGALDCLGITSTDTRAIRSAVVDYCKKQGIKIQAVDICATHCHSALDTQGVSTQFFYKFLASGFNNLLGLFDELPGLEPASEFKEYFISQSIDACKEALSDVESGKLYYDVIDSSEYVLDKRGLVEKEDLPPIVAFKFVPDSGSEETYFANVTCHPTSFSANHEYVGSDYIYYAEKYIKEHTGGNLMIVQGSLGQLSRDIEVDTTGMTDYESWSASANKLGTLFADDIISAAYENELEPIINVKHQEIIIAPENSILALACEIKLVNNPVYYIDGSPVISSEVGYLEFGHKIGFAMFPAEFYPETFWGTDIIDGTNWDGTEWQYPSLHNSVDGVDVYPISLCDDATGYVLTDNNYAFMGHIIGDGIPDELLSVGKHEGSFLVGCYLDLIEDFVR